MCLLASSFWSVDFWQHVPWVVFVFCLGACVGSFINVVIYRLPLGMSLRYPPSRCPVCGWRLRFFRENLPILGWLILRGRCRKCQSRFSPAYAAVELGMAAGFVGLYVVFFWVSYQNPWWGEVAGQWWQVQQFVRAWPAWVCLSFLLASLFAMTMIDARTFTIPIQIPVFITVLAFVLWPLQGLLARSPRWWMESAWPIPGVGWTGLGVAIAGGLGVVMSCVLLWTGRLRYSFADYADFVEEGEALGDYPHARREMRPELMFLLPVLSFIVAGGFIGQALTTSLDQPPPVWLQSLGGSLLGYLVGGGIIWLVRILGTLAFGREAMGMGDVHLLAAVGAVLGWFDPIIVFFVAPFIGLAWTLMASLGRVRRELPYGPHLALATLLVLLARPLVVDGWKVVLPGVPMPARSLVNPPDPDDRISDRMSTSLDRTSQTVLNK